MKKIILILCVFFLMTHSIFAEEAPEVSCEVFPVNFQDFGGLSYFEGYDKEQVKNYSAFLGDGDGNTYQILGSDGQYYVKVNDTYSQYYSYISNSTYLIDIHSGSALFWAKDSDNKGVVIYFDGEDFHESEKHDSIYNIKLSPDGKQYAYLVNSGDQVYQLYVNGEFIYEGYIVNMIFSRKGGSYAYLVLSGEKVEARPGVEYHPDIEIHKDGKLLKRFLNSTYEGASFNYYGNTTAIGLKVTPYDENGSSFTNDPIFIRDTEEFSLGDRYIALQDIYYTPKADKFYLWRESNFPDSYITDSIRKTSDFHNVHKDEIVISDDGEHFFSYGEKTNLDNYQLVDRYFIHDWKEIKDTSHILQKWHDSVIEEGVAYTNTGKIQYIGAYFDDDNNVFSFEHQSKKEGDYFVPDYYYRVNGGDPFPLEIDDIYVEDDGGRNFGIFSKSFGYFVNGEGYNVCKISLGSESESNKQEIKSETKSINVGTGDTSDTFKTIMEEKLDYIDTKLSPQKRVNLYKRLRSALEDIPEENRNNKMKILLELSILYHKNSVKDYILQK